MRPVARQQDAQTRVLSRSRGATPSVRALRHRSERVAASAVAADPQRMVVGKESLSRDAENRIFGCGERPDEKHVSGAQPNSCCAAGCVWVLDSATQCSNPPVEFGGFSGGENGSRGLLRKKSRRRLLEDGYVDIVNVDLQSIARQFPAEISDPSARVYVCILSSQRRPAYTACSQPLRGHRSQR